MNYSDNALNVLAAKSFKGIGRAWFTKNWDAAASVPEIAAKLNRDSTQNDIVTVSHFEEIKESIAAELRKQIGFADGLVALGDPHFPSHRGTVKNSEKPIFLLYHGDLSLLDLSHINIAVIGGLEPDAEIESIERKVVSELVERSAVIVSGLALGCDGIAHRQTLQLGGKTVAILPGQLTNILPRAHEKLAREIVEKGGLLLSEYWTEPASKREMIGRYQERDRLQALFSDGIVLSASYAASDKGKDSGSRLAMGYARDYAIPRAVIYDETKHADNPQFNLNREIISADSSITIINEDNTGAALDALMSERGAPSQPGLFG